MARYEERRVGFYDRDTGKTIARRDPAWADFEAWMRAGNLPDPEPVVPPSAVELAARTEFESRTGMRASLRADSTIAFLRTHTPVETEAWVNANVTDLASAKNVLSKLAMVVAYLARERLAGE